MGRDRTWKKEHKFKWRHKSEPDASSLSFYWNNPNPNSFLQPPPVLEPSQPSLHCQVWQPPATSPLKRHHCNPTVGRRGQLEEPPRPVTIAVFVDVWVMRDLKVLGNDNHILLLLSYLLFDIGYVVTAIGGLWPLFLSFPATSAA